MQNTTDISALMRNPCLVLFGGGLRTPAYMGAPGNLLARELPA